MNNPEQKWKADFQSALSDFEKPGMDLSWEKVETGIRQVKRKRLAFYWLGAASVAAVLAIFFVSVFNVSEPVQTEKEQLLASNQEKNPMVEVIGTETSREELVAESIAGSVEEPVFQRIKNK